MNENLGRKVSHKVQMMTQDRSKTREHYTLSVLVPALNEEATIGRVLKRLVSLPCRIEQVIVIDDGSTDATASIVAEIQKSEPRVSLIRHSVNQGKTAAIRSGLSLVTGQIVIVQDADLEYSPEEIPDVIRPILENHADVVYGSRFLVRKATRVLYFYHYLANKALTFLCNLLTNRNMTDVETCYKAFLSGVLTPLTLSSKGFGMEIEVTAMICRTRARTYEVPISYYGRTYEEGKKIGMRDGIAAGFYILWYNLVAPLTRKGRRYVQTANAFLDSERIEKSA